MPQTVSTEYLAQLVTVIKQQQQTGVLHIEQIGNGVNEQGEIYFEDGRMFYAHVGEERGRPALEHISAWAHVIYTFQPINRPPSWSRPTSARTARTDRVTRPLLPPTLSQAGISMVDLLRSTPEEQPLELLSFTQDKVMSAPFSPSQSFILRGEALETYVPESPASISPASQRWTTHQYPEIKPTVLPSQAPTTSPLGQVPDDRDAVLPGQQAVFKAKITITSPQTMQKMERRERIVFVLLDGRRTLQHIAKLLHQTESEVGQILLKLMKIGFAEYVQGGATQLFAKGIDKKKKSW